MNAALMAPGPRSAVPMRSLLAFRGDPLGFLEDVAATYGDVARFGAGRRDIYLISHPDLIRNILVVRHRDFIKSRLLQRARDLLGNGLLTSEHDYHLRQRRMIQPSFHRERIAGYAREMITLTDSHSSGWKDGETVDMAREMNRLTLAIAGRTLLGTDVGAGEADEIGASLTDALGFFDRITNPFGPLLDLLPVPSTLRLERARARLNVAIHRIIDERRAGGVDQGDLLSTLLHARDEEGAGERMTDQQIRDEILTIFLAGHETTANALSWTWVLLSRHPDVERRLHQEVDALLLDGRPLTPDDYPHLEYTRKVLTESMRLFPPAWSIGREPLEDFEAGGYSIRAGSIVLTSPWVVHRDPRFFAEPLRFDPDRWTPEMEAALPKLAYFPFSAGPRKCIGDGFAWMEGVLVLAAVARRWRARLVPGHPIVPQPQVTLRLRHGARMTLHRREPLTR